MKYVLGDRRHTLNTTRGQFEEVRQAYMINQKTLALEDKYFLVLQNYADFEKLFLDFALNLMIFGSKEWVEHVADIQTINGKLLNLLSATKAYLDQVPQHLNEIFGDNCSQTASFQSLTSVEFDKSFEYRVMSAVRNHVQHNDFPISHVEQGQSWDTDDNGKKLRGRYRASASVSIDELVSNTKIRAATRHELAALKESQLDIKLLVRTYVSSFARLHFYVRDCVSEEAARCEDVPLCQTTCRVIQSV